MCFYIQTSLQPESIKTESSILPFLFDLLILSDHALTSLQESYTKTKAQPCFQSWPRCLFLSCPDVLWCRLSAYHIHIPSDLLCPVSRFQLVETNLCPFIHKTETKPLHLTLFPYANFDDNIWLYFLPGPVLSTDLECCYSIARSSHLICWMSTVYWDELMFLFLPNVFGHIS